MLNRSSAAQKNRIHLFFRMVWHQAVAHDIP